MAAQGTSRRQCCYCCFQSDDLKLLRNHNVNNNEDEMLNLKAPAINAQTRKAGLQTKKHSPKDPDVTFVGFACGQNVKISHDFREFTSEKDLGNTSPEQAVGKYIGVLTSPRMMTGVFYWEIKLDLTVNRREKPGGALFDIGICESSSIGRVSDLFDNWNAFSCHLIQRENGACLECTDRSKDMDIKHRVKLSYNREKHFHFLFLLNLPAETFSVQLQNDSFFNKWYNLHRAASYTFAVQQADEVHARTNVVLIPPAMIKTIPAEML